MKRQELGDDAPPPKRATLAPTPAPVDDDVDPLDAFMSGVTQTLKAEAAAGLGSGARKGVVREEYEKEDNVYVERKGPAKDMLKSTEVDSDEEVYAAAEAADRAEKDAEATEEAAKRGKKAVELLAKVDHSTKVYADYERGFYTPPTDMPHEEAQRMRAALHISVSGASVPPPVARFEDLSLPAVLQQALTARNLKEPTPIQKQALPTALSGRDILGLAPTGSGKTLAYLLPLLVHCAAQDRMVGAEGPIALVLAPTHELAQQIYAEARSMAKPLGLYVCNAYGGIDKMAQFKELRQGADVVVATPGRLMDLLRMKATNLVRCSFVVLDEADKCLGLGFEEQVRSLLDQVRPDRHTLLFSATCKHVVERLAFDALTEPVRIVVGVLGAAAEEVEQNSVVVTNEEDKWNWLFARLPQFLKEGNVILFASQRGMVELAAERLNQLGYKCAALHGEKDQGERQRAMYAFKNENIKILVASDVAARGLDVPSVRTVVNLEVPRDLDAYTHRIGRTGRAGLKGKAFTFITPIDNYFATLLVRADELAGRIVSPALLDIAMTHPKFRANREHAGSSGRRRGGRGGNRGGIGAPPGSVGGVGGGGHHGAPRGGASSQHHSSSSSRGGGAGGGGAGGGGRGGQSRAGIGGGGGGGGGGWRGGGGARPQNSSEIQRSFASSFTRASDS